MGEVLRNGIIKEDFRFESRDGVHSLHAVRYLPAGEPVGVLQIVHGMAEYVERYEEFALFMAENGFVVTGEDHLGHGGSVPAGETYGYFCQQDPATVVVRDVHRLKKMTQEKFPGLPYVILGHSMGSMILRNYLCRYGSGISGAVVMGTATQPGAAVVAGKILAALQAVFMGPRHKSGLLNKIAFGAYNNRISSPRTANDWLSQNEENVTRYEADPLCGFCFTVNGFQTLFELISRMQKPGNIAGIPKKLPLFLVAGEEDPVGSYGKGVKQAADALKNAGLTDLEMKLYPGDRHEILNEDDRQQVMEDILNWIKRAVLNT